MSTDPITHDRLRFIMPHARQIAQFIPPLNAAVTQFNITPPLRLAMWLANLAHESGEFFYMEEIADGAAYDTRADLGNTKPEAIKAAHAHGTTTGRFYKGHGPIQITGYDNHKACGEYLGLDLVNNPRLLCQPDYGCAAAGWFWWTNNLSYYADREDFDGVCDVINRGRKTERYGDANHFAKRLAYYERARQIYGTSSAAKLDP